MNNIRVQRIAIIANAIPAAQIEIVPWRIFFDRINVEIEFDQQVAGNRNHHQPNEHPDNHYLDVRNDVSVVEAEREKHRRADQRHECREVGEAEAPGFLGAGLRRQQNMRQCEQHQAFDQAEQQGRARNIVSEDPDPGIDHPAHSAAARRAAQTADHGEVRHGSRNLRQQPANLAGRAVATVKIVPKNIQLVSGHRSSPRYQPQQKQYQEHHIRHRCCRDIGHD